MPNINNVGKCESSQGCLYDNIGLNKELNIQNFQNGLYIKQTLILPTGLWLRKKRLESLVSGN